MHPLFDDDRFLMVPETMVDGLIVIDAEGMILYTNPACERLFSYPEGALVGRNVALMMPDSYAVTHDIHLKRHRDTRVKRIIGIGRELLGRRSDGREFPMYLSVGEAQIDGATVFVGIIYDLTDKKRAEEMILHHQKLDAIGQLSGGIAHDFNNLLSVIGGNLELVSQLDLAPAARRALSRAQDAVARGSRITQRLLAFARRQPLATQQIDVNRAIEDLFELLRRTLGRTIEVDLRLEDALPVIEADIDQFETAVLNLALNSRDAMPDGGTLTIETQRVEQREIPASPQDPPNGVFVRLSVSDSGAGMDAETRRRAMEPFFTTKGVGSGTGLGLSMVYGFLKQIGGHVQLYSEPGRGTRVSLFFPVAAEAGASDEAASADADPAPAGKGETILVVEDDPDVRIVTVGRLEGLGYQVRLATDADSATRVLETAVDIDLALIDVVMPGGKDGHTLADEIERRWPGVRIVITSGYSERMAARDRSRPADRPFLPKPATRGQLARIIRGTLDAPAS